MKKLLIFIAATLLLTGCSHSKWMTIDERVDKETIIKQHFPELYEQAQKGEVELHKLKSRKQKDGTIKYQLSYTEIGDNDETDELLQWLTIYIPMLMDN